MQPENFGKTIVSFLKKRHKIYIKFDDDSEIETNEDVIAEFLLYCGKKINDQDLKIIQQTHTLSECFSYTYKLLSKRSYTEKEIKERLKKKGNSDILINKIITKIKLLKLIDDNNYAKEYIEYYKNKGYGPLKIKKDLYLKGIDKALVDNLIEDTKDTLNVNEKLINKLLKQFMNSNDKKKRQQIYESLIRRGFPNQKITEIFDEHVVYDEENEKKLLKKDYMKIKEVCIKKYKKEQLFQQIVSKLTQKGYNYHDIMALKEEDNDD